MVEEKDLSQYDSDVYFAEDEDPEVPTWGNSLTIDEMKERKRIKKNLTDSMRWRIYKAVKYGKGEKAWLRLTGYSIDQLRDRLELQFVDDMNWGNYGNGGWDVDHIVPVAIFDYQLSEDLSFKQCWQLTNLRPLWGSDHSHRRWVIPMHEICNREPYMSAMRCKEINCEDCCFYGRGSI